VDAISGPETFFIESSPDALPLFGKALSDLTDAAVSVDLLNQTLSLLTTASLEGSGQAQALAVVSAFVLAPTFPGAGGPLYFLLAIDTDTSLRVFGFAGVFSGPNVLIETNSALLFDEALVLSDGRAPFERRFQ
jgi:hypothetical protein